MKSENNDKGDSGQKYYITIEGEEFPWNKETISVREIKELANIPSDQAIVEETPDGGERNLTDDEIIHLKPGHRYGRAPKYRRG